MKTCFKCKKEKPYSEFYVHPQMGDGHLGKCKTCTRKDSEERRKLKEKTDLAWVLNERERHREKSAKTREAGKATIQTLENKRDALENYRKKFPLKHAAHVLFGNALKRGAITKKPCEVCGNEKVEGHHDDYEKPLEVRWLCKKHHMAHHVAMRDLEVFERLKHQPQIS